MTKEQYLLREEKVIELLNFTRSEISSEGIKGIEHFLEHGELAIAFEILCFEITGENVNLPQEKEAQLLELADSLLDPNTVNDTTVFEKLKAYVSKD